MSDPFYGQINAFGFSFAPRNWGTCAGQLLAINQNQTLFSLLGTFYGGDGRSTYGLPNLISRSPVGYGVGHAFPPNFQTYQIGQYAGFQDTVLATSQMPAHSHEAAFHPTGGGGRVDASLTATTEDGNAHQASHGSLLATSVPGPSGADQPEKIYYNGAPAPDTLVDLGGLDGGSGGGITGGTVTVGVTGGSVPVAIQSPVLAVNFCIAMDGLYPPRN